MRIITFYSEKGGVGKTMFNELFSSYLAYNLKEKTYAMDFDHPKYRMYNFRQREEAMIANPDPAYAQFLRYALPVQPWKKRARVTPAPDWD